MTSSPFAAFQNAVLVFQVPTGAVKQNSVGNRVVETATLEIKAMLNPVADAAQIQQYIGDDDSAELMTGYLVSPLQLPFNLLPPIEGKATIKTNSGLFETGTFNLLPSSQSAYITGIGVKYLCKIVGVFRRG